MMCWQLSNMKTRFPVVTVRTSHRRKSCGNLLLMFCPTVHGTVNGKNVVDAVLYKSKVVAARAAGGVSISGRIAANRTDLKIDVAPPWFHNAITDALQEALAPIKQDITDIRQGMTRVNERLIRTEIEQAKVRFHVICTLPTLSTPITTDNQPAFRTRRGQSLCRGSIS